MSNQNYSMDQLFPDTCEMSCWFINVLVIVQLLGEESSGKHLFCQEKWWFLSWQKKDKETHKHGLEKSCVDVDPVWNQIV